jgi:hypothetical protein
MRLIIIRSCFGASRALQTLVLLTSSTFAHAQSAPPPQASQAQIEAAKQQGQVLGLQLQNAPVVDSGGNVVTNSDGTVKRQPRSGTQAQGATALMQNATGLTSYQGLASPANGGQAGATATIASYVDFGCTVAAGTVGAAAGVSIKFNGCLLQNNQIAQVGLQVCSKLATGNLCASTDYSLPAYYDANAYSTVGGLSLGIGCNNDTRSCRISVSSQYSIVGSGAGITQQASASQNAQELRTAISGVVASQEYQNQVDTQSATRDCYVRNQQSFLTHGTVTTCDGQQSTAVSGGPSGNTCTPTRSCARTTTTTSGYTTTCTRDFSLTTERCASTVPTRDCTITVNLLAGTKTSSCPADEMNGATVVATSPQTCTQTTGPAAAPASSSAGCTQAQYTESNVFPSHSQQQGDCVSSPLPLAGAFGATVCATGTNEQELSCEAGGWYGRTLSDQECQAVGSDSSGAQVTGDLNYQNKAGCGYCVHQDVGYTCYGAPTSTSQPSNSCEGTDLSSCTLTSAEVESQYFNLTLSQLETYQCAQSSTQCAQWTVTNSCPNVDASYGTTQMPVQQVADQGSFNQAITTTAVAESIAQSSPSANATNPQIFNGQDMRCTQPLGFVSGVVAQNCCQTNLQNTSGSGLQGGCSQDEVKLAAERRAKHEVYIGSYCSKERHYAFFSVCTEQTQTYCVYGGILPRLIQTQGRQQLADDASSSFAATLQSAPYSFAYYQGQGGWASPITVNGQQVSVFQEPAYCTDPHQAAAVIAANSAALRCPSALGLWFAVCDKIGTCADLPTLPEAGSQSWQLSYVDPLQKNESALSRYVLALGACDTQSQQCSYQVSAWPAGIGGRAVVTQTLSIEITSNSSGGDVSPTTMVGDSLIKVTPAAAMLTPGTLPTTVPASVSNDGGSTWTSFTLPTQVSTNFIIPQTDIHVAGGCAASTGLCQYTLTGTVVITAKPWGSAQRPDCTGFTIPQLSVLDFSKMDFSEWVATVKAQVPATGALISQAQSQASQGNSWTSTSPTQGQVAIVQPLQDMGPFVAQLSVSPNWPQAYSDPQANTDPIFGVSVDWGDCSGSSKATPLPGGGFSAEHTYNSPATAGICDRNGPAGPGAPRDLDHQIQLTLDSKSGSHAVTLDVRNVYQNFTETNGSGGTQSGGASSTATGIPPTQ